MKIRTTSGRKAKRILPTIAGTVYPRLAFPQFPDAVAVHERALVVQSGRVETAWRIAARSRILDL